MSAGSVESVGSPVSEKRHGPGPTKLVTRDLGERITKPGVADSRACEDDVGEHLSKIG
jgi:hypothetical protein